MRKPIRLKNPPAWMRQGALADFHSILGGPVTHPECVLQGDPHQLNGERWVVFIAGVHGCVAIENLSLPPRSVTEERHKKILEEALNR